MLLILVEKWLKLGSSLSIAPLPLFVLAEKFFHVCKQCSSTTADRPRRRANSGGTKRPKYLKG